MISVSVIIPVFNAAQHLERCIESLLAQTLPDCEFIFVNDGSTDGSQSIIEKFRKNDNRIVLINQQNQGVSAARNAGLAIAKGIYIGFVDADDTIETNMFQTLVDLAQKNQADIVGSRYVQCNGNRKNVSTAIFTENQMLDAKFIKKQIIPYFISDEGLNAIWNKIYKRELLTQNNILFPAGVTLGEDGLFNLKAFHFARKVYFTDFAGYHYHETQGSATRNFSAKDYYQPIVEAYLRDYNSYQNSDLTSEKIDKLKAEKFLGKAISLIHEYTNPANKLGIKMAHRKISALLNDTVFSQVINQNYKAIAAKKGKFERFFLWAARHKWVSLLIIAAAYSRLRNK